MYIKLAKTHDVIYQGRELYVSMLHNGEKYVWQNMGPSGCLHKNLFGRIWDHLVVYIKIALSLQQK